VGDVQCLCLWIAWLRIWNLGFRVRGLPRHSVGMVVSSCVRQQERVEAEREREVGKERGNEGERDGKICHLLKIVQVLLGERLPHGVCGRILREGCDGCNAPLRARLGGTCVLCLQARAVLVYSTCGGKKNRKYL
jgi:hypothetical protein